MASFSIIGVLSTVQIWFHTQFHGTAVGTDALGNRYYKGKPRKGTKQERRWVLYKTGVEASLVPPLWHGWLHHQTNRVPDQDGTSPHSKSWQKPHQQNLTGTVAAYLPPGHTLRGGQRDKATGDYVAWQPPR